VGNINARVTVVQISEKPATVKFHAQSVVIAGEHALIDDLMEAPTPLFTLIKPRAGQLKTLTKEKFQARKISLKMDKLGTLDIRISIQAKNRQKSSIRAIDMEPNLVPPSLMYIPLS
jgi:hypothetical protein